MRIYFLDTVHPDLRAMLVEAGHEVIENYSCSYQELPELLSDADGIVIRSRLSLDAPMLKQLGHLKFIARSGAGLENIDLDVASAMDIAVYNSPEGNMRAVGEHATAMLLSLLNKIPKGNREIREGRWLREDNRGRELGELTVGLIGFGNMGRAFAKCLRGFDCKVMAYDKYHPFKDDYVQSVSLEQLQNECDVISFHTPQTEETKRYFDAQFLSNCSKPVYLINTARGSAVVIKDLVSGLKSGSILGACLDVLEYEPKSFEQIDFTSLPPEFKELISFENVILSPHVAGWTHRSLVKLATTLGEKILKYHS